MKYLLIPIILSAVSCNEENQSAAKTEVKHKTEEEHRAASRESIEKTIEAAHKTSKY